MSDNYSISLEGIRIAEQNLDRVARNVAVGQSPAHSAQRPASSGMVQLSSADPVTKTSSGDVVDYAHEMVTLIEVKIGVDANLKVMDSQQQLDRNALDLLV